MAADEVSNSTFTPKFPIISSGDVKDSTIQNIPCILPPPERSIETSTDVYLLSLEKRLEKISDRKKKSTSRRKMCANADTFKTIDRTNPITGDAYDNDDDDEGKRGCCCFSAYRKVFIQQPVSQQEVMSLVESDELDMTFRSGNS